MSPAPAPAAAPAPRGDLAALAFRHRSALFLAPVLPVVVWSVTGPSAHPAELAGGAALALLGVALRLWAVRAIGKRARVRHAGAKQLLEAGPYGRVRNPLYVANSLVTAGLAVAAGGQAWALAVLAGSFAIYALVVHHEEAQLAVLFGDEYRDYCARVPRWLPRLGPVPPDPDAPEPWPWGHVLRREVGLVVGVPLAVAGIGLERGGALPIIDATLRAAGEPVGLSPAWVVVVATAVIAAVHVAVETAKLRRHEAARAALEAAGAPPPAPASGPSPPVA